MRKLLTLLMLSHYALTSFAAELYPSSVVWGKYCGECVDECSTFRRIDKLKLQIDKTDKFFRTKPYNPIKYVFVGVDEPKTEYDKFSWLLQSPLPTTLHKREMIFGEPDAYDQCGYLIDYNVKGAQYRTLIDPENIPDGLKTLISKLFDERL